MLEVIYKMQKKYILLSALVLTVIASSLAVSPAWAQTKWKNNDSKEKNENTVRPRRLYGAKTGTVTAINGTSLTIHPKTGADYTVNTDGNTKFFRNFGGKSSLSEIAVNDRIMVQGTVDSTAMTILASKIVDTSIQKIGGRFYGTITSVSGNTLVLASTKRGNLTVTIGTTTVIKGKSGTLAQSDLVSGDKIWVTGVWDKVNATLTEVTLIRDLSR